MFLAVRYPPNFTVAPRRALTFLPIHFRLLRKSKAKSLSLSCRCMCSFPCETTPVLFDQQHKEQFTYEHAEHYAHTHTHILLTVLFFGFEKNPPEQSFILFVATHYSILTMSCFLYCVWRTCEDKRMCKCYLMRE